MPQIVSSIKLDSSLTIQIQHDSRRNEVVTQSIAINEPIIYVSVNYRLSAYGFLGSKEMLAASQKGQVALNAGLLDILAGLEWVQHNIGAFGGDKNKVWEYLAYGRTYLIGSFLLAY